MKIVELKRNIDEATIRRLETALDLAKTGDLHCVTLIGRGNDGSSYCAWAPSDDLFRDLAEVTRLQHQIQKRFDTNEEDA